MKMKNIYKALFLLTLVITLTASVTAASLLRDVKGKENKGIKITLDGGNQTLTDANGNPVYPVIIDGATYLPLRATAKMVGLDVSWDPNTSTIALVSGNSDGGVPTDLAPVNTNTPSTSSTSSGNEIQIYKTSEKSPVPIGTTALIQFRNKANVTADVKFTVTGVQPASASEITNEGYTYDAKYDYLKVNVDIYASNFNNPVTDTFFANAAIPEISLTKSDKGSIVLIGSGSITYKKDVRSVLGEASGVQFKVVGASSLSKQIKTFLVVPIVKGSTGNKLVMRTYSDSVYMQCFFKIN